MPRRVRERRLGQTAVRLTRHRWPLGALVSGVSAGEERPSSALRDRVGDGRYMVVQRSAPPWWTADAGTVPQRSVRCRASRNCQRTGRVVATRVQRSVTRLRWRLVHPNREAQMTTTIVIRRPSTVPDDMPRSPVSRGVALSVGAAVRDASEVALALDPGDERWAEVGPLLTAFVDAVRRALGLEGSPILPHEQVPTVLRLRDLARLAGRTAAPGGASVAATPLVRSGLRSLQDAARRCPLG